MAFRIAFALKMFVAPMLIAACSDRPHATDDNSIHIEVVQIAEKTCQFDIDGKPFTIPGDEQAMFETLKLLSNGDRPLSIDGDSSTPYRCIGGVIYQAQRAGIAKIGFISEPEPAAP